MKKEAARRLVLGLFRDWAAANGQSVPYREIDGGLRFYTWLENHRADALAFRDHGDKWQTVHGWLLRAGLVTH